jgi:hypothetical protein
MKNHPTPSTLVDPKRFRTIQDLTRLRPDCGASIDDILVIDDEYLLIIDMNQIGNLLNPYNSPTASYVRTHGVIVQTYIRPESTPVFWKDPFLLLPLSHHLKEGVKVYSERGQVVGRVSCPSGTFLLLPDRTDMPAPLNISTDEALEREPGAKITLPNGTYRVFYEQFEPSEGAEEKYYQNIAVQRQ